MIIQIFVFLRVYIKLNQINKYYILCLFRLHLMILLKEEERQDVHFVGIVFLLGRDQLMIFGGIVYKTFSKRFIYLDKTIEIFINYSFKYIFRIFFLFEP